MRFAAVALAALIVAAPMPASTQAQAEDQAQAESQAQSEPQAQPQTQQHPETQAQPAVQLDKPSEAEVETADAPEAFIFFRSSRKMGLMFLRETSAEREEVDRADALRFAQAQYEEQMTEWRRIEAACSGDGAAAYRCRRARPQPVPPSPEDAAQMLSPDRNISYLFRNHVFTEEANGYTYLYGVKPGTYVLYGQRDMNGAGWTGVCLCMGSVSFEVPAGQVVDLGTITFPGLEATGARNSASNAMTETGQPSISIVPPVAGAPLPARRPDLTVVPAQFRAAAKMPNFMGLHVDRHPALAGVLRYERDVVIDDQTGQPVAARP